MLKFSSINFVILIFLFIIFFLIIFCIDLIELTLLVDKKINLDLSFLTFFRMLIVPIRLVSTTLSISFLETSTAASAQQSIIKSNLGNKLSFL